VVASERDEVTPLTQMREMQQRISAAELAVIGDAGHLSNIEQPGEFNSAVRRFCASRFGG
jgi:3-oxoadipate enol-lactonase